MASTATGDTAALSTPLTGAISDANPHVVGTAASGTAQLLRSSDGGATMTGLTAGGNLWARWAFSGVTGPIVNEQAATETSASATYYLAVTLTAGSITYRIAQ